MLRVGVTGGIGSGKSLVCEIIARMGFPVYNADLEARNLTNTNSTIIAKVKALLGNDIYTKEGLDRKRTALMVFQDAGLLNKLNAIIHPEVANHFSSWCELHAESPLVFLEAAILLESGMDKLMDRIVAITAPLQTRIRRVVERDGISPEEVERRMGHQLDEKELVAKSDIVIRNDGEELLLPRVVRAIEYLKGMKGKK